MKADWRVLPLAASWLAFSAGLFAQAPASPDGAPVDVRAEIKKLAIADAKRTADLAKTNAPAGVLNGFGVVTMDPFVVQDPKLPTLVVPKYEAPFMKYLRTGTILSIPGKTITARVHTDFSLVHGFTKSQFKVDFSS